ncbi:MAG: hypothetical protein ACI8ZM_004079 [Crocinitomix sp.]|jgi:hypothetical protein
MRTKKRVIKSASLCEETSFQINFNPMKLAIFSIFICGLALSGHSQENVRRIVLKKSYLGLGGGIGAFQDAKFSNVPYSGLSGSFVAGTSRESDTYFWSTNFNIRYAALKTSYHVGSGYNVNANYNFDFTKKLPKNYQFGGKWSLMNVNFTNFSSLGNNSIGVIFNSTLSILGRYSKQVGDDVQVNFEMALGIFSMAKEATSFAYSASQKVLETGVFDFQNDATTSPLSLSYASLEPLGKFNKIETTVSVDYKERWQIAYQWDLLNYRTVNNYPITIAAHTLSVRFNYISKTKTRINKESNKNK